MDMKFYVWIFAIIFYLPTSQPKPASTNSTAGKVDRVLVITHPRNVKNRLHVGPLMQRKNLRYWNRHRKGPPHHPPPTQIYTQWSQWTKCDPHCKQERERFCLDRRKCGSIRHVEERLCSRMICEPLKFDSAAPLKVSELDHIRSEHSLRRPFYTKPHRPIIVEDEEEEEDSKNFVIVKHRPKKRKKPQVIEVNLSNESEEERDDGNVVLKVVKDQKTRFFRDYYRRKSQNREEGFGDLMGSFSVSYPVNTTAPPPSFENRFTEGHEWDGLLTDHGPYHRRVKRDFSPSQFDYYDDSEEEDRQTPNDFQASKKAVFSVPKRPQQTGNYTKWSRWSKCTSKCTTRRFKKCRARQICGNDVIREIAYCYTEGSFCHEWIGNQLQNASLQRFRTGVPGKTTITSRRGNAVAKRRSFNEIDECGIPVVRDKRKHGLWKMLKIIGGKAARKGQWPWQVAILNRFKEAFCGGTLISPHWIITAAHCVRKKLYVRLGEHNLQSNDGTEIELKVEFAVKHPKYDKHTVDNDVALLKLPKEIQKNTHIGYACLPKKQQQLPVGETCTIIGWGKRRHWDDAGTSVLHEAEVPIVPLNECRNVYYDYTITKNMFCAGHKRGRIDTCSGDSGGPLLCRDTTKPNEPWTLFGITSFGDGCGKKNKFGIYTKIPNYIDWVVSIIGQY